MLLAGPDAPFSPAERAVACSGPLPSCKHVETIRRAIAHGDDPLGRAFCELRSPKSRREQGAVYTPRPIIDAMVQWAAGEGTPERIVDPGAGSGRFLWAAGKAFPCADLIAVEIDPLAALTLRANAVVLDMADRLTLLVADYRAVDLPAAGGPTLFLGNPPYVRHHDIAPHWKDWFARTAAARGLKASKLAGLHIHFILKTCGLATPGDYGAFITSAEWLDVNYGDVMRKLVVGHLGGKSLHVIAPAAMLFADAATTGAITCFRAGCRVKAVRLRSVDKLSRLNGLRAGRPVPRARLESARRWSPLLRTENRASRGDIELGELCRVHRGQVTGCNAVWIAGAWPGPLPQSTLIPAVTRARELFHAGPSLSRAEELRRVIDLPIELDGLDEEARQQVHRFLAWARKMNADRSYIARHRRAWWSVGLKSPAPILCTYMARRPPAFVRNRCNARHINIAHGVYPRDTLPDSVLDALSVWLRDEVCVSDGRTYAGGLTKFEPKELERIRIPSVERLHEHAEALDIRRNDPGGLLSDQPASQRKCGRMIRSMNSSTCSMSGAAGWMVTCSMPASSSVRSLATMSPTLPSR